MPAFTTPLHERNDCHLPAGRPDGGQFCSKGGAGFTWAAIRGRDGETRDDRVARARLADANPWGLSKLRLLTPRVDPEDGTTLYTISYEHGSLQLVHDEGPGGDATRLIIQQTEVDHRRRGKGEGQKLLLAGRDFARSLGLKGLVSYKSERSPAADRSWEALRRKGHKTRVVRPTKRLLSGYRSTELELFERNDCHLPAGRPDGGQFCSKGGIPGGYTGRVNRPRPIRTGDIDEALRLIEQGQAVELTSVRKVNTLLRKLAVIALDAKAREEEAPIYDLCKVTVAGTNLFCAARVRSEKYPNGRPRVKMPQLGGTPVPGSPADKLPRKSRRAGAVDGADAFVAHLRGMGITTAHDEVPAALLKASQAELVGSKVATMMMRAGFDPRAKRIFISKDNYVIDGHHRWAAVVGLDAEDGRLGDVQMRVTRVNALASELIPLARRWTREFGIRPQAAGD